MAEIKVYGTITPGTIDKTLLYSDNEFDKEQNKYQSDINKDFATRINTIEQTLNSGGGGSGGSTITKYVHEQITPSTVWVINHNKGVNPIIQLYDENNGLFYADIEIISATELRVKTTSLTKGKAIII